MPFNRRVAVAAGLAVAILLASGIGYRVLAEYLSRSGDSVPLPPGALDRLPMRIGDWEGRDVPLSAEIIKATDTDAHINRTYSRKFGAEAVGLYVAYGVRARDLMPHRPEVCYPGSGWTLEDSSAVEVPLSGGSPLSCRIYRFSRAGPDAPEVTVLNYYIVDGEYCPDVSLLRSKAWRGQGGVRYMAQVQITCTGSTKSAAETRLAAVREFAVSAGPGIRALLPEITADVADRAKVTAQTR